MNVTYLFWMKRLNEHHCHCACKGRCNKQTQEEGIGETLKGRGKKQHFDLCSFVVVFSWTYCSCFKSGILIQFLDILIVCRLEILKNFF